MIIVSFRFITTVFKGGKHFTLLVIFMFFSDIFSSFGYYLRYINFSYLARFLYTIGLCWVIYYTKFYIKYMRKKSLLTRK